MADLVIDASVIVKWFTTEEYTRQARRLLPTQDNLVAPDFMPVEVTSALLRKYRRGEIEQADLFVAREAIRGAFELVSSDPLLDESLQLAASYARSSYDCTYVVIARMRGCQVITADQRLYDSLAAVFPDTLLWVEDIPE